MSDKISDTYTPASIDDRVNLKRAQLFVEHASGNVVSFILGALLIVYTLFISHVNPYVIIAWGIAILALTFAIVIFQRIVAKTVLHSGNKKWFVNMRMILGAGIGLLYGVAPFALPASNTQLQDTFMFIILSSFVAVALLSYSVMPRYFLLLNFTVLGLLTLHFLLDYLNGNDPYYLLLIVASLIWQFIFLRKGMQVSKTVIEGLVLYERLEDETAVKKQAQHLAMHDELTGLPNRRYFDETSNRMLHASARRGSMLGIIVIDLNDFKSINDDFGHAAGDLVLQKFAKHLRENIRDSDFAARIGGDEFYVLIENLVSTQTLSNVMHKPAKTMSLHLEEKNLSLQISTSVGHATFPEDGTTLQHLLQIADQRMYQQKRSGAAGASQ
jgi:diguanylate cyclase (GGDEF)-like protein